MDQIEKYIVKSLIVFPKNDKEIGFNSALITLLKGMAENIPLHLQEVWNANNESPTPGTVLNPMGDVVLTENQAKMRKACKDARGDTILFRRLDLKRIDDVLAYLPQNKLGAVKTLKEVSGLGLKEAKDIIDIYCTLI